MAAQDQMWTFSQKPRAQKLELLTEPCDLASPSHHSQPLSFNSYQMCTPLTSAMVSARPYPFCPDHGPWLTPAHVLPAEFTCALIFLRGCLAYTILTPLKKLFNSSFGHTKVKAKAPGCGKGGNTRGSGMGRDGGSPVSHLTEHLHFQAPGAAGFLSPPLSPCFRIQ